MTKIRFLTHTIIALLAAGLIGYAIYGGKPAAAQTRTVRVVSANATSGTTANVVIEFVGLGNENGIGFSLTFDQTKLSNPQAVPGNLPSGANLNPNANQAAQGRFGILLALSPGTVFPAGTRQLLTVTFDVAAGAAAGAIPIGFGDLPIGREIADATANVLPATFTPGTLTIIDPNNPVPTLTAISPNSAPAGTAAFTLMVSGTNFVNGAIVRWNGGNRTTTFVSSTKLTASIPASDIAGAGSANVTVFNPTPGGGTSAAATFAITPPVVGNGLMFYPLDRPFRLLDTRPANERPGPAFDTPGAKLIGVINAGIPRTQQARVTFDGQTIPASARAIVGTATVVNFPGAGQYAGTGNVTFYPSGAVKPEVSNLNYAANQTISNSFTVGLNASGAFDIFTYSDVHLVVDVVGYYAPPAAGGLYYHPIPKPIRLLETRSNPIFPGCDTPRAAVIAGAIRTQQGRVMCDGVTIPSAAQALNGNLTTVNAAANGIATVYAGDLNSTPLATSLAYVSTQAIPNAFVTRLAGDGNFKLAVTQTTDVLIDIAGYFSPEANDVNGQGLLFTLLNRPIRLLETREDPIFPGCDTPRAPLAGNSERIQQARVTCDGVTIPTNAQAIIGNATVVNFISPGSGNVTLFPSLANRPEVSNLNYVANQVIPNAFTVGLSNNGQFTIYVFSTIHLLIDVTGYYAP